MGRPTRVILRRASESERRRKDRFPREAVSPDLMAQVRDPLIQISEY